MDTTDPVIDSGSEPKKFVEFTDGRKIGEWGSRYFNSKEAALCLILEFSVLILYFWVSILFPFLGILLEEDFVNLLNSFWAKPPIPNLRFLFAFCGGMFGGTMFTIKWFYKSVAEGFWNRDRIFWRLANPFIAGGLALVVYVLIFKDKFGFTLFAYSWLVGYFADNSISKLNDLADATFGRVREKPKN